MIMENKVITLRSVFGKIKEYHFQPCKMPNGARYPWVKPVRYDGMGNSELILTEAERNSEESQYFIAEDEDIVVTDGTTFDLNDPLQYNRWMSIKDSDLIVPTRDARDSRGNLFIDGDKKRYGIAELYVDVPGEESAKSVTRKQKITKAWSYIGQDSKNGRVTKCKLLGKDLSYAMDTDVEDYLYQMAEKNPDQIIDLYESGDIAIKLLIIDARRNGVIIKKDGMLMFADNILGATDDAVVIFLKKAENKRIKDLIALETYPEYAPVSAIEEKIDSVVEEPKKAAKTTKK